MNIVHLVSAVSCNDFLEQNRSRVFSQNQSRIDVGISCIKLSILVHRAGEDDRRWDKAEHTLSAAVAHCRIVVCDEIRIMENLQDFNISNTSVRI